MKTGENQLEQKLAFWPLAFWPLVGPIMLFASLTLLFLHFPEKALLFTGVVFVSLAACWQLTWRGVVISLALLALCFGYHSSSMDSGEMFWHLGMSAALTLGFVATALASEEMAERLISLLSARPQIELHERQLSDQIAFQSETIENLKKQLELREKGVLQLENEKMEMQQRAQLLQADPVQIGLLQQNLTVAEAQKIAHWRALRSAEGKLQQLREQFEEKTAQLAEVRRHCFIAEEQAEKWKRLQEEEATLGSFYAAKPLLKHIQKMERAHESALTLCQREVEALESLVTHLVEKGETAP